MKRIIVEVERGLQQKTHKDADIKCFVTYVQDLPNGKGNHQTPDDRFFGHSLVDNWPINTENLL